jgi:hypothetical protein
MSALRPATVTFQNSTAIAARYPRRLNASELGAVWETEAANGRRLRPRTWNDLRQTIATRLATRSANRDMVAHAARTRDTVDVARRAAYLAAAAKRSNAGAHAEARRWNEGLG